MKLILITILFSLPLILFGQLEKKLFTPNFESVSSHFNDITLVDRVKFDGNIVYYEFNVNDTISEFIFINDSIYKYRKILEGSVLADGQFFFRPTAIDSTISYPIGQYEELMTLRIHGDLIKTGIWHENQYKLYGRYNNGKKYGTWKLRTDLNHTEFDYNNDGQVISILNPSAVDIKNYTHWIDRQALKVCAENKHSEVFTEWIEIVQNKANCRQSGWTKLFRFQQKTNKPSKGKYLYWAFNSDQTLSISFKNRTFDYCVVRLGEDRLLLRKLLKE